MTGFLAFCTPVNKFTLSEAKPPRIRWFWMIPDENNLERTLNGPLAVKPASYANERNKFLPLLLEQFK